MQRRKLFSVALIGISLAGCLPSPLPPGVKLKRQDVSFSSVFGTHRARFDGPREVVTRDVDTFAVWGGRREWEATIDVVDGTRSWKTRCALRPVENGVLVPNTSNASVDRDPELVCWTLSDGAPFELAMVLERRPMTGYVVFGTRRLIVSQSARDGFAGPAAVLSLDGNVVAVVDPSLGCASRLYFDDTLEHDVKTTVAFVASVLAWAEPYTSGLRRNGC